VINPFAFVGRVVLEIFQTIGSVAVFAFMGLSAAIRPPFFWRNYARHFIDIGYLSLPVVALTTLFSGMVLALQSYSGFSRFSAEGAVAMVVALSITRELAPVLAGLMVAGRIGAAMAAEIGTMRVTEQIDALEALSTNPYSYLVAPRLIAGILMMPFLVAVGDIIGIMGGYIVGVYKLGFNSSSYLQQTWDVLQTEDVVSGLVKAAVYGFIVTLMGCYHGYRSTGGAQGVGRATTQAVVSSAILILIANYFVTELFFTK
jgi:phospholipid/cholesterol/gamma-HCH transport system permease protein